MELPDVLKKGVLKFNMVHRLKLNNYSKCLMSPSTALQTILKHTFSEEIHKHVSLKRKSFKLQIIGAGIDDFSNHFWWNYENQELQSEP